MILIEATKITTDLTEVTNSTVGGYSSTTNSENYLFYIPASSGEKALYKKRNTAGTTTYYDKVEPNNGTMVKTSDGIFTYVITKTGAWQ